tara:strand:- start:36 stop:863 length:828 start_codon:yes stop_codon:yes gene_type:complete
MNVALCFCVRNCGDYLLKIFKNIEDFKKYTKHNVYVIFVYDNCSDNTATLLMQYKKLFSEKTIIKTIKNNNHRRTVRVANARNVCLYIIYNEINDINYHIMIDADDVCCNKWNYELIEKYLDNFDNDDWDCISFNRDAYYDIWALQFDNFKHHCWGWLNRNQSFPIIDIMKNELINKINSTSGNSIEVYSAFNGFCIYKSPRFREFYYDGYYKNVKELISEEDREKTIQYLRSKYNINVACNEGEGYGECCEHIFYHISALKQNRKIKISKFKVV